MGLTKIREVLEVPDSWTIGRVPEPGQLTASQYEFVRSQIEQLQRRLSQLKSNANSSRIHVQADDELADLIQVVQKHSRERATPTLVHQPKYHHKEYIDINRSPNVVPSHVNYHKLFLNQPTRAASHAKTEEMAVRKTDNHMEKQKRVPIRVGLSGDQFHPIVRVNSKGQTPQEVMMHLQRPASQLLRVQRADGKQRLVPIDQAQKPKLTTQSFYKKNMRDRSTSPILALQQKTSHLTTTQSLINQPVEAEKNTNFHHPPPVSQCNLQYAKVEQKSSVNIAKGKTTPVECPSVTGKAIGKHAVEDLVAVHCSSQYKLSSTTSTSLALPPTSKRNEIAAASLHKPAASTSSLDSYYLPKPVRHPVQLKPSPAKRKPSRSRRSSRNRSNSQMRVETTIAKRDSKLKLEKRERITSTIPSLSQRKQSPIRREQYRPQTVIDTAGARTFNSELALAARERSLYLNQWRSKQMNNKKKSTERLNDKNSVMLSGSELESSIAAVLEIPSTPHRRHTDRSLSNSPSAIQVTLAKDDEVTELEKSLQSEDSEQKNGRSLKFAAYRQTSRADMRRRESSLAPVHQTSKKPSRMLSHRQSESMRLSIASKSAHAVSPRPKSDTKVGRKSVTPIRPSPRNTSSSPRGLKSALNSRVTRSYGDRPLKRDESRAKASYKREKSVTEQLTARYSPKKAVSRAKSLTIKSSKKPTRSPKPSFLAKNKKAVSVMSQKNSISKRKSGRQHRT